MLKKVITALIKEPAQALAKVWTRKMELSDAKHQREIELAQKWEGKSIDNSGWKDEFWTIVLAIPLIGVFVPSWVPTFQAGFSALNETPEWYRWGVAVAIGSAFGVRKFAELRADKK